MFGNKTLAVLLFAILANVNGFRLEGKKVDGRIVGGNATDIRLVPYQVSITRLFFHFCGGSIIAPQWILTAAHCMEGPVRELIVFVGSNSSLDGGKFHLVDRYINHKSFDLLPNTTKLPTHDISLIHLTEPIEFDDTKKPIPLFEEDDIAAVGSYGVVSGWGVNATNNVVPTKELRAVLLPIVSREMCAKAYENLGPLPEDQICAGYPEGGKDACQGDSGGPLAIGGRLAGIVSWGLECGKPNYPSVFTEVAKYRKWIKEHSGV